MIKRGKAFVFGNNVDTDQIYPGQYLDLVDPEDVALHALEGADENFIKEVQEGDIVVAGTNFGCGSSREYAPMSIKGAKVSVVIAESFARIFFRNSMNVALPVIVCKGIISKVDKGDILSVDLTTSIITNETTGEKIQGEEISEYAREIIESGKDIKAFVLNRKLNK
ncbi:3-isopropylmalate dehydratase [uncultured Ilyobacter sp.]|uniref:LeuD/DmdB family oxidoreductase small subunit n=1 Tax=uncultured Ilyobacter sp. TaxID=544433 RepID=UPI0029C0A925|nr:3-isopropylmalate dehydratase [uncultured Ilyobacter sp.]